mmetsp:Transcript_47522/g.111135  ORF Transcript_47522/g.111135 Transcript_47522/m.111135 type:complete len:166 (+) Transcript_47522:75-572(+)
MPNLWMLHINNADETKNLQQEKDNLKILQDRMQGERQFDKVTLLTPLELAREPNRFMEQLKDIQKHDVLLVAGHGDEKQVVIGAKDGDKTDRHGNAAASYDVPGFINVYLSKVPEDVRPTVKIDLRSVCESDGFAAGLREEGYIAAGAAGGVRFDPTTFNPGDFQ